MLKISFILFYSGSNSGPWSKVHELGPNLAHKEDTADTRKSQTLQICGDLTLLQLRNNLYETEKNQTWLYFIGLSFKNWKKKFNIWRKSRWAVGTRFREIFFRFRKFLGDYWLLCGSVIQRLDDVFYLNIFGVIILQKGNLHSQHTSDDFPSHSRCCWWLNYCMHVSISVSPGLPKNLELSIMFYCQRCKL